VVAKQLVGTIHQVDLHSVSLPSFLRSNILGCGENLRTSHPTKDVWP
jgi:hypothetical protein